MPEMPEVLQTLSSCCCEIEEADDEVVGTVDYMSPEQAMGERTIDARSDIYALGAMTYEMLVGDPPFTGSTVQAIVAKAMTEKPIPPAALEDSMEMSAYIESALSLVPPTEKQVW